MSRVVKTVSDRDMAHIVEMENEYYYVDSTDTFDMGFETMVFKMEITPMGDEEINWSELYCECYSSYEVMEAKHNYIINHLEEFVIRKMKGESE